MSVRSVAVPAPRSPFAMPSYRDVREPYSSWRRGRSTRYEAGILRHITNPLNEKGASVSIRVRPLAILSVAYLVSPFGFSLRVYASKPSTFSQKSIDASTRGFQLDVTDRRQSVGCG